MGKKPFSAKAKREQLRQKRQANTAAVANSGPAAAHGAPNPAASNSPNTAPASASPRRSRAARAGVAGPAASTAHRYRLIFAEDTDTARKRQRALAHVPVSLADDEDTLLARRTMSMSAVRPFPDPAFAMPRRPEWSYRDTVNVVDKRELAAFRKWMDRVARPSDSNAAYFEGNLETWRQLWRVIERSDVLVLVADIRFPALHFVPDLYEYVTKDLGKGMVLALNKCDLVPADVLLAWKRYFETKYPGMAIAMFSSFPDAKLAPSKDNSELLSKRERRMARSKLSAWGADQLLAAVDSLQLDPRKKLYLEEWRAQLDRCSTMSSDDEDGTDINFLEQSLRSATESTHISDVATKKSETTRSLHENGDGNKGQEENENLKPKQRKRRRRAKQVGGGNELPSERSTAMGKTKSGKNTSSKQGKVAGGKAGVHNHEIDDHVSETESALSEVRVELDEEDGIQENMITIGVVGHPNAGKSSLINGVFRKKVVSTSRTPGHTKHLQTIFLSESVRLCDCPGLVFPGLAPRELQILAGMYPIAQVREPYAAIKYLADRVPLVNILGLESELARLDEHHEECDYVSSTGWTAWKICEAWAMKRGFRTAKAARLDVFRAANNILRLALDGRIVLATVPDGYSWDDAVCAQFASDVTWDVHDDADACVVSASGRVAAVLSGTYDIDEDESEDDEDVAAEDDDFGEDVHVSVNTFSLLEEVA